MNEQEPLSKLKAACYSFYESLVGGEVKDKTEHRVFANLLHDFVKAWQKDAEPKWQPIETAPKDGKEVLVYYKNSMGKCRIIRAAYTNRFTEESDNDWAEYSEEKDCYYSPEGWYEQMDNWDEYGGCFVCKNNVARFTHWMPLPNPPKDA